MVDERRYRQAERRLFLDAGIEPAEHRITLPTIGVDARVLEVGHGTPTVFLHGGPDAAATWSYLAGATAGLRCLLVDRPGTGLSDPPLAVPDAGALPRYVAQLTIDVLDAFRLDHASLVGSSLGGYSALRTAADHPDRVDRVVLAGCPAFVPGWTAPGFFNLLRTPVLGRLVLAVPATRTGARSSLRQMGHRDSLSKGRIPAPMIEWIRALERDTGTMRNDAAMIRACGTWRGGFDPGLDLDEQQLGAVRAPCLVLAGTDDPVGGDAVVRRLASILPHAEVDVRRDAGHLPWLDAPAWCAERIAGFLRRGTDASPPAAGEGTEPT